MEASTTGSAPSESEVQQLFLPYRGFCSRKGVYDLLIPIQYKINGFKFL